MPEDTVCRMEETENKNSDSSLVRWRSCRYLLAYLCFLGSFCVFAVRRNMSLTIVCMVNRTEMTNISDFAFEGEFTWTREEQSFLLGSFFYGYSLGGIPGGWLADRNGARMVLIASVLVSGVSTVFMTLAQNYFLMVATRILAGLMCGAYIPALAALFAKWSPTYELVRLLSIANSGAFVGAASSLAISGILCEAFGWRSVFYVTGTTSIIWAVISLLLIGSNPQQCRFIRTRELKHIQASISPSTKRKIPWRMVSKSLPIYAIIVGFCLALWYNTVEAIGLNLYVDDILHMDIVSNGIQTAIPQVVLFVSMMLSVFLADKIIRRFRAFHVRKTAQATGGLCQMASLLTMAFLDHNDWVLAILMFNLGRIGYGICIGAGYKANLMDTAPQLAGTLTGIGNSIGLFLSFLCPVLIGFLTADRDRFGWQMVFYISSGVILSGNVFFLVFAGSKPLVLRTSDVTDQECEEESDDCTDGRV